MYLLCRSHITSSQGQGETALSEDIINIIAIFNNTKHRNFLLSFACCIKILYIKLK